MVPYLHHGENQMQNKPTLGVKSHNTTTGSSRKHQPPLYVIKFPITILVLANLHGSQAQLEALEHQETA